jgi:hypothetical protein
MVGMLEELPEALWLLEQLLPTMFRGILATFESLGNAQHARAGAATLTAPASLPAGKEPGPPIIVASAIEPATIKTKEVLRAWNSQDVALYGFARQRFKAQLHTCAANARERHATWKEFQGLQSKH